MSDDLFERGIKERAKASKEKNALLEKIERLRTERVNPLIECDHEKLMSLIQRQAAVISAAGLTITVPVNECGFEVICEPRRRLSRFGMRQLKWDVWYEVDHSGESDGHFESKKYKWSYSLKNNVSDWKSTGEMIGSLDALIVWLGSYCEETREFLEEAEAEHGPSPAEP